MDVTALLLADSRFPGGGHAHSGGVEEAAARGTVTTEADLLPFLRFRLLASGALTATFAAAAAHQATEDTPAWRSLDEELDARTPSAAQRTASRAQGRATARAAKLMVADPHPVTGLLAVSARPHHPLVVGALVGRPADAALAAAYLAVSGPASAAVRLLGLDPLRVNAAVAGLGGLIAEVAARGAATAHLAPAELPAPGSPGLDLLAEEHDRHHREEVRLFAS